MPFLSIIVPIYNTEPYLNMCLDSILRQEFVDFELILVNDGSTDNCSVICDEYAEADTRITVIHQANSGAVSARKAGLSVAKGQYIGYVDSDDWIEVDMYKSLCNAARDFDVDIVICDIVENYPLQEVKRAHLSRPVCTGRIGWKKKCIQLCYIRASITVLDYFHLCLIKYLKETY